MIKMCFFCWLMFFMFVVVVVLVLLVKVNIWLLLLVGSCLVGENKFYVVENDGGFLEVIVKKYNVGFFVLLQVNSGVDFYVLCVGSVLMILL